MSAFSQRILEQKNRGFYRVADLEGDVKEVTHIISHVLEQVEMFGKLADILNFQDTPRQLQLSQKNLEFLLEAFGEDPETYGGKAVTLYLEPYGKEGKLCIRLKLAGADAAAASAKQATARLALVEADMNDAIPF